MAHLGTKYGYKEDGRRYVQYYFAEFYDPERHPKRRRISLKTRDKRVAHQKFAALEREVAMKLLDPWCESSRSNDGLTLAEAIEAFLADRGHHCAKTTVATYRYVLDGMASQLPRGLPVRSVEARHVIAYLDRGLADATHSNYADRIRIFFQWCVNEGYCRDNPAPKIRPGKKSRRQNLPAFVSEKELEDLLTTVRADASLRPEIEDNRWLTDAIEFAAHTGLRRAELSSLEWRHVNLKAGFVTVANTDRFTTKSGRERRVPLAGRALEIVVGLADLRSNEDDRATVFVGASGRPINGQYLSSRFRHYRRLAGLSEAINFHSLRHTFASWAVQRGMNLYSIKEIMGHANIKQTQVYASLSPDTLMKEMKQAFG